MLPSTLGVLKALWRGWLIVARKIGHFQVQVILMLFYFVIMAPFALVMRIFTDPLDLRGTGSWRPLPSKSIKTLEEAKQQF